MIEPEATAIVITANATASSVQSGNELYKAWTGWTWKDIQYLRPDWSVNKCWKFIEDNEDSIVEAMIDTGWDVIQDLLGDINGDTD